MNPSNIIVYTKIGCPWCNALVKFLDTSGLEYEERVVTDNPDLLSEMMEKSGQDKAPTVDIGGHIIADTDKEEVEKYLKEKGALV
jgi:glutaredoxin 3